MPDTPPTTLTKTIRAFYADRLRRAASHPARRVGWASVENQTRRFAVLTQIAALEGSRILDAGCGLGDLYGYLNQRLEQFSYLGVDITEKMIEEAARLHPDASFILSDILFFEEGAFDYVLASGLFAIYTPNCQEQSCRMIEKLFALSRRGVAFNMLNRHHHPSDDTYMAFDPEEVLAFCRTITPQVTLRTDYLPQDFTIYLYHSAADKTADQRDAAVRK